jgi:hypothetical protein
MRCTIIEDDRKGYRKLRVGHRAVTKFLWLSVTFDTGGLVVCFIVQCWLMYNLDHGSLPYVAMQADTHMAPNP